MVEHLVKRRLCTKSSFLQSFSHYTAVGSQPELPSCVRLGYAAIPQHLLDLEKTCSWKFMRWPQVELLVLHVNQKLVDRDDSGNDYCFEDLICSLLLQRDLSLYSQPQITFLPNLRSLVTAWRIRISKIMHHTSTSADGRVTISFIIYLFCCETTGGGEVENIAADWLIQL